MHHAHPSLIGTIDRVPYNLRLDIGNIAGIATIGVCEICTTMLRLFDQKLPNAMYGKVGEYYADIIGNLIKKVCMCVGHSMWCVTHQHRIKKN